MTLICDLKSSLALSHSGENDSLNKIIRASLRRKGKMGVPAESERDYPWSSDLFLLNECHVFPKLTVNARDDVLRDCNDFVLSESYFIEKAGLAYCAKMILLGETTETRQIYGLIASDESTHLQWLSAYVKESLRSAPLGKFIFFISRLIEECDANTLYFLVQTVLEGWGISYYRTLAATCQWENLKKTLTNIMKDEAIHHKTGEALFKPDRLDSRANDLIYEGMKAYLDILKAGPQNIVEIVEKHAGPLNIAELTILFEEMQTELTSKIKIHVLKKLMDQPAIWPHIARLEEEGYFEPYSAAECASIYGENRSLRI